MSTHTLFPLTLLTTDAAIVGTAAWLLVRASGHGERGALEAGLAWLWSFVALIAGVGVILGMTGGFGVGGFLVGHALALGGLLLARRGLLGADWAAWRAFGRHNNPFRNLTGGERALGLALGGILLGLTMIAVAAEPAVVDALTYHLPRIGHWLQDGRIQIVGTADARLNFVAVLPDIVMAWLVGGTNQGFGLVVMTQAIGGIMTVGATVGLARETGLGRTPAILAGMLVLGMANVAAQFTAAQTDLFTTGVFAASFYLWLLALRRGETSMLGALGAGLSLGAKGTLFYLAPSAVLWVVWLAWRHRLSWPQWRRTLVVAVFGIGLFAAPGFVRNWRAYGDALGPVEWVKKHHQGFDSVAGQMRKLEWNLTSSLVQTLDPQSQPFGLATLSRGAGAALLERLPAKDPYTLDGLDRKKRLEQILALTYPDADAASFGGVPLLLLSLGSLLAVIAWRRESGRLVAVWSAGVVIFLLFFNFMQQWHPFAFRYFVLVAPWVAVVGAWGIEQLGRRWRWVVWTLVTLGAVDVTWRVTLWVHQGGWKSVVHPEGSMGYFVAAGWREWSQQLDRSEARFCLALPEERPISAFYRQEPWREVVFRPEPGRDVATAEEFVRGEPGWVIVPAVRFLGREGRVATSVWLFAGEEGSLFSVAAYRSLGAGEEPPPVLYRKRRTVAGGAVSYDLLAKAGNAAPIRFALTNPGKLACGYVWASPLAQGRGRLAAGERTVVELKLPEGVGEVKFVFDAAAGSDVRSNPPSVELLR